MSLPFDYDLHLTEIPGKDDRVMICLHGYGANFEIGYALASLQCISSTIVSFNLPDHDLWQSDLAQRPPSLGTFDELLPIFYVLKRYCLDQKRDVIDLYGFSAGGAALINALVVLHRQEHLKMLQTLNIGPIEIAQILSAIQKGRIILDAPLKSVDEILEVKGSSPDFEILAKNYQANGFRPIDSVQKLDGLKLTIYLYFEIGDEILTNRDDALFIQRLQTANHLGTTHVLSGSFGGHNYPHLSLWRAIK